jgi:bifunctional non-homologous end joining protein LigD
MAIAFRSISRRSTPGAVDWTTRFRKIADDAWHICTGSAIIDGEAVAPAKDGTTDFSVLQNELKGKSTKIALVAFDLLYLNGYDLRQLSLIERKAHLKKIINGTDVQFSESFEVDERRCTRTPARSGWKASSPRSATASIIRDAAMIG